MEASNVRESTLVHRAIELDVDSRMWLLDSEVKGRLKYKPYTIFLPNCIHALLSLGDSSDTR